MGRITHAKGIQNALLTLLKCPELFPIGFVVAPKRNVVLSPLRRDGLVLFTPSACPCPPPPPFFQSRHQGPYKNLSAE